MDNILLQAVGSALKPPVSARASSPSSKPEEPRGERRPGGRETAAASKGAIQKSGAQTGNVPKNADQKSASYAYRRAGIPDTGLPVSGTSEEDAGLSERKPLTRTETGKAEEAGTGQKPRGTSARFEYNEKINRVTITISDREDGEVIKEIPPEDTQRMLERLHLMTGIFMNEEV